MDIDRSLASIGGLKGAEEISGFPPVTITNGITQINQIIDGLFTPKIVHQKHDLLKITYEETIWEPSPQALELGFTGIVVDSISHSFRQDMRILEKKRDAKQLEMQDWGWLERNYNLLLAKLKALPCWIILTCHTEFDKDQATGAMIWQPLVKGSTKNSIVEYFDVVLYSIVSPDKKSYRWQTMADPYRYAKDRIGVLPTHMEQDYNSVLTAYREAGYLYPKIFNAGPSGTGKTKAIKSINKKKVSK